MTECDYFLHKHSCDPTSIFERGGVRRRALTERECCDLLNAKDAEIERLQVQLKSEAHGHECQAKEVSRLKRELQAKLKHLSG